MFDDWLQTPPDQIQPVAQMYLARADAHTAQLQVQQNGAVQLQNALTSQTSTNYQLQHTDTMQKGQGDANAMRTVAHTLLMIMNIIQIILTLITIIKILWAAAALLAASGFFDFGISEGAAAATAETAVETTATGEATNLAAKAMLRAIFNGLKAELQRRLIGTLIGAGTGAAIGIGTGIADHRSFGDFMLHLGEDTFLGASGGFEMSGWTPWTSGGVAYGLVQAGLTDYYTGSFNLEGNFDTVMGDSALFTGVKGAFEFSNAVNNVQNIMSPDMGRTFSIIGNPDGSFPLDMSNVDPSVSQGIQDATGAQAGARNPILPNGQGGGLARPGAASVFSVDGTNVTFVSTTNRVVPGYGLIRCSEGNGVQFLLTGDGTGMLDSTLHLDPNAQPPTVTVDPNSDVNVYVRQVAGQPPCNLCQTDLQRLSAITGAKVNVFWESAPRNAPSQIWQWPIDIPGSVANPVPSAVNAAGSGVVNGAQQFWNTFIAN